jgi:hypothetical protein
MLHSDISIPKCRPTAVEKCANRPALEYKCASKLLSGNHRTRRRALCSSDVAFEAPVGKGLVNRYCPPLRGGYPWV